MSNILGVDVSTYQGKIDWSQVHKSGIKFAIFKIMNKNSKIDPQFENNWKGCTDNGIEIKGVYNYSYATTVAKAISDAKDVLKILGDRKTTVILDVEDNCQKGLGSLLIDIINNYASVIIGSGNKFMIYTGEYFYHTYIEKYANLNYDLWIANYGVNDGLPHENKNPKSIKNCVMWQYTSKGVVAGIKGVNDLNIYFGKTTVVKPPVARPTLRRGSRGTEVKNLQQDLNYTLGDNLVLDGLMGAKTTESLKRFQAREKIKVDGIYGNTSFKFMTASINR